MTGKFRRCEGPVVRRVWRLGRLMAAQGVWLRRRPVLAATAAALALPPALALWYARAATGSLDSQLLQFDERVLPLWTLVAGAVAWSDAEPPHRPLLLAWPAGRRGTGTAKAAATLGFFAGLCLLAGWGLPRLYLWATGAPAAWGSTGSFAFGLLAGRPLAVGTLLLGLVSVAGAAGFPAAGVAAGALLWLANTIAPGGWADRFLGGALNLFAWTGGTAHGLGAVTGRTVAAGLGLLALSMAAPDRGRTTPRAGRFRCQLPFLRQPAVFLAGAGLAALPVFLLLLYRTGRLSALQLVAGFQEYHGRYLPLLALVLGAALWVDGAGPHRPILRAWRVTGGRLVAAKSLVAAGAYLTVAAGVAQATGAALARVLQSLPPEIAPLPPGAVPAWALLRLSLAPAGLLLGWTALGGALGTPGGGLALGTGWWMLSLMAGGGSGAAPGGGPEGLAGTGLPGFPPASGAAWPWLATLFLHGVAALGYGWTRRDSP